MTLSWRVLPLTWRQDGRCYANTCRSNSPLLWACILAATTMSVPCAVRTANLLWLMQYNMEDFLTACVKKYEELGGATRALAKVRTPFLPENPSSGPAGRPLSNEPGVECPWCFHSFAIRGHLLDTSSARKATKAPKKSGGTDGRVGASPSSQHPPGTTEDPCVDLTRGALQPIAAKVLMKILYAARMARFDLLRAVNYLACYITKWTPECDRRLTPIGVVHPPYEALPYGWVCGRWSCGLGLAPPRRRGLCRMHRVTSFYVRLPPAAARTTDMVPSVRDQQTPGLCQYQHARG
jgi:hypothetical protein